MHVQSPPVALQATPRKKYERGQKEAGKPLQKLRCTDYNSLLLVCGPPTARVQILIETEQLLHGIFVCCRCLLLLNNMERDM